MLFHESKIDFPRWGKGLMARGIYLEKMHGLKATRKDDIPMMS